MARMIRNRQCVVCGEGPVQMWTLDNMSKVAVTYLCNEHSAPLAELMEIAGDLPPDEQVPLQGRGSMPDPYERGRRESKMVPLLNWTPPD